EEVIAKYALLGPRDGLLVERDRHGDQDHDDCHDNHQLDQREPPACFPGPRLTRRGAQITRLSPQLARTAKQTGFTTRHKEFRPLLSGRSWYKRRKRSARPSRCFSDRLACCA